MQQQLLQLISFGAIIVLMFNIIFVLLELVKVKNPFKDLIIKYQMLSIAVVSFGAVVGSILLSTYFKLAPCELCWYQRVFLFSIPIIASISIYKKELHARTYVFVLSIIGAMFAIYHAFLQSGLFTNIEESYFCNTLTGVDCAIASFTYFGFVTVPVISFATFTLLMILSYAYSRK